MDQTRIRTQVLNLLSTKLSYLRSECHPIIHDHFSYLQTSSWNGTFQEFIINFNVLTHCSLAARFLYHSFPAWWHQGTGSAVGQGAWSVSEGRWCDYLPCYRLQTWSIHLVMLKSAMRIPVMLKSLILILQCCC